MSGPSLRQLDAHRSIHDGAFIEAKHLTDLLEKLYEEKKNDALQEVADTLVEHWEMRVLAHAQSEEEGFYKEKLEGEPQLVEIIAMLKRDHDLLRMIVAEIKQRMQTEVNRDVLDRFRALLFINEIHSREEERLLF
ncbi:hypothetical protein GGR02_002156 [Anoxybacillus voinovskiensis]|uniref:Hemerythrin-like domain-containing protein n=1 Tax=Anoxybacteroides voinovskiense TaxID=230470 RepID=A0A840DN59_9BACL|nr:hemerythrin domain-containing protein [Anoxybacillus voinovskiensis]MBB4074390.1 hypothetical protein [Anoxybacillus voinovskiensis]GGJ70307.1 hypothetical protein GCM10008982_19500 [Anoxybacillus voinovskiensis]